MSESNKTSEQELSDKQHAMSDEALIGFVGDQITELARTGGRSHKMCVPPEVTDTDMLFSELVRRFKKLRKNTTVIAPPLKREQLSESFLKSVDGIEEALNSKNVCDCQKYRWEVRSDGNRYCVVCGENKTNN